jgi:hypothetical protein
MPIQTKAQRAKIDPALLERLQRSVLKGLFEICEWRYGNDDLSNNERDRNMLTALFRFGISMDEARRLAPSFTIAELKALKDNSIGMK